MWKYLFRALGPGLVPILIYIVVELAWGELAGIAVALCFGVGEFLYGLIRHRHADWFVAADMLLLVLLGSIGMLSGDALFFKMKPALLDIGLAVAFGILGALPETSLQRWLGRMLRGMETLPVDPRFMRAAIRMSAVALVAHAMLVAASALWGSTALWGFVSGILIYPMLGASMYLAIVRERREKRSSSVNASAQSEEPVDYALLVVTDKGRMLAARGEGASGTWDTICRGKAPSASAAAGFMLQYLGRAGFRVLSSSNGETGHGISLVPIGGNARRLVALVHIMEEGAMRGLDPLRVRLWHPSELQAAAGAGMLASEFIRELEAFTILAPGSIVKMQ
ncbi:MAG: septation protein IspZ [Spirochaetaceae bacterium]|nr:septation protein IspZ [Spirochaetaceae bacterium]